MVAANTESVFPGNGTCAHCGLPTGSSAERFCCRGCETVYSLIQREGLAQYYALRPERISPPARLKAAEPTWLEDAFPSGAADSDAADSSTSVPAPVMVQLRLDVQGVHCAACVWLLEELYSRREGARFLRVNPLLGKAELLWQGSRSALADYFREVERFGYRFGPDRKPARAQSTSLLLRLGIAAAAAMNAMIFSVSFYSGLSPAEGRIYDVVGCANLGLATLVVWVGGPVFFRPVLAGLTRHWAHLDLPIALGILLSYTGSVYAHFTIGPQAAYFDTVATFTTLMLFGRWLQEQVLERNRRSLLDRTGSEHLRVRRFASGAVEAVPVLQVNPGDQLLIAPGDLVPVDGTLESRNAQVAVDWITGESDPISFGHGALIPAGAFNTGARAFRLRATQRFVDSRVQSLLLAPAASHRSSAPERFWRRVSLGYVTGVLLVATLGLLLWWGGGVERAIAVAVAILVVTCPCAIGLAAPLARELAAGHLRRRGVFILKGSFFERALDVRKVLFDKTGTLTSGELSLTSSSQAALETLAARERWVLQQMTARSNHPVARAVHDSIVKLPPLSDPISPGHGRPIPGDAIDTADEPLLDAIEEHAGQGMAWSAGGVTYRFGRAAFVGICAGETAASYFALDGRVLVVATLDEELPAGTSDEIRLLERGGYTIHVLSGDCRDRVTAAARRLGLSSRQIQAELSPEDKALAVAALDRNDTLMVGDGLNDALSFEAAHATATPAVDRSALSARADFYYVGEGIASVRWALGTARQLQRVIRTNVRLALLYNLTMVALCLMGKVSPLVAAIVMPVSSIFFVALTSWRLRESNLSRAAVPAGARGHGAGVGVRDDRVETPRPAPSLVGDGPRRAGSGEAAGSAEVARTALGTGTRDGEVAWTS